MAQTKDQLALNLPRTRVALEEEEEELRLRMPTKVAEVVKDSDPLAVVKAMARAAEEQLRSISEHNRPMQEVIIDGKLRPSPPNQIEQRQGWPSNENPELYTAWETRAWPTWDGYYDITDSKTGTLNERWWFTTETGGIIWLTKGAPVVDMKNRPLAHDQFVDGGFAWRGLRRHPDMGYPCPPYSVSKLPKDAAINGQYIKRRRATLED